MEREFLEGLGLDEETVEAIIAEAERVQAEREAELQRQSAEVELDRELEKQGARSLKAVKALLEPGSEGNIESVKEQLEAIKAEHGYLFATDAPRVVAPSTAKGKNDFGFKFTGVR